MPLSPDVGDRSRREGHGMDERSPAPSGEYGRKKGVLSGRIKTGLGAGVANDGNVDGRSEMDGSWG